MAVVHVIQFTDRVAVWGEIVPIEEPIEPTDTENNANHQDTA